VAGTGQELALRGQNPRLGLLTSQLSLFPKSPDRLRVALTQAVICRKVARFPQEPHLAKVQFKGRGKGEPKGFYGLRHNSNIFAGLLHPQKEEGIDSLP
jgi:hypothetical protein